VDRSNIRRIEVDTVEIWRIINIIDDDPHPIHVHLVDFLILDRQLLMFLIFKKTGNLIFTGPPIPPDPYERDIKIPFGPPLLSLLPL